MYVTVYSYNRYVFMIDAVSACLEAKLLTLNQKNAVTYSCHAKSSTHSPHLVKSCYKYLGVQITSDLMCDLRSLIILLKTRKLIGILYQSFYEHSSLSTTLKLYSFFIRRYIKYVTVVWSPFLKRDIELLEGAEVWIESVH